MSAREQIKLNSVKWMFILFVIVLTLSKACSAEAQGLPVVKRKIYWGLEGALGARSYTITSDQAMLSGLKVQQGGGSMGLVVGLSEVQVRARLGSFYSLSQAAKSIQLVDADIALNIYPRQLIKPGYKVLQPYAFAGINKGSLKIHGSSVAPSGEPMTLSENTKLMTTSIIGGVGFEFRLPQGLDFVSLFAEMKYAMPIHLEAGSSGLNATTVSNQMAMNVGISFGAIR